MGKIERRQSILNHAREVFARRGYHDAKIDEIVASAGIARGTFYLYFKDKRAVFEEIVDRAFTHIGMAIVRVDPQDRGRSVAEQVQENIRRIVGTLLEDRSTTKILLTDAVGVDPAFDRKLQSFYEVVENLLVESLREGQDLGIVAPGDPRMFAYLMMGVLKEILYQVVRRDAAYTDEEVADGIFNFLERGCLRIHDAGGVRQAGRDGVRDGLGEGVARDRVRGGVRAGPAAPKSKTGRRAGLKAVLKLTAGDPSVGGPGRTAGRPEGAGIARVVGGRQAD